MSHVEAARLRAAGREFTAPPAPRPRLRLRRFRPRGDLRASVGDAACVSTMVGIGETYFAAFALALGTGETLAGLVATVPMLIGASLQLGTPWFLQRTRSYKRWVVAFAALQATALLAITLAARLNGVFAAAWILIAASCYWAASQATGPAWNTWIEEIVPRQLRFKFFALRALIGQASTLAGFVAGGLALHLGQAGGWLLPAFVGIFMVGSSCRFLSAWFLNRQSEPSRGRYQARYISIREMFTRTTGDVGTPLVLYLFAMQTAVQISGPYFAPYMLAQHHLSYFSYMVLVGLGFFGKVLALPLWGHVAHYAGARRLLWIGGTSIVPVAALWLGAGMFSDWQIASHLRLGSMTLPVELSAEMAYLACVQLLSGFVWAAYELAMQLMFFEAIPRRDRPSVLTFYNFGNAAAQVTGGLIGAAILQLGHETYGAYMAVFCISSLVRLCTVPMLANITVRTPEAIPIARPTLPSHVKSESRYTSNAA